MDLSSVASPIVSFFTQLPAVSVVRCNRLATDDQRGIAYQFACSQPISASDTARGCGVGSTPHGAFLKALLELGESAIRIRHRLKSRSGMAGGLFQFQTIQRAKAELIERDAFLYHYRVGAPIESLPVATQKDLDRGVRAFRLKSATQDFTTILIVNVAALYADEPHLEFATGCARTSKSSLQKALEEFYLVRSAIRRHCRNKRAQSIFDHHLLASFDHRNIDRFRELIESREPRLKRIGNDAFVERESLTSGQIKWKVEKIQSPIRFFRFYRVQSPELIEMSFGHPESQEFQTDRDLFHPFW